MLVDFDVGGQKALTFSLEEILFRIMDLLEMFL